MNLICTKSMTYNTRRLQPGDPFTAASARDAKLLIAIGKAKTKPEARAVVPPAPSGIVGADLTQLRNEARGLGVTVDLRWGEKRLLAEIAASD